MPEFQPILLWAVAALPLLGFLLNGVAAFAAPGRKSIPTLVGPGVVGLAFLIAVLNFIVAFELTSILLLVAIVGAVILAKRRV